MRIKLKNTPQQIELVKAMGSRNKIEALKAQEAFAAAIAPVARKVLNQAGFASQIYQDAPYDQDDSPSIPLDLFYQQSAGFTTVWSQNIAGAMPTSQTYGIDEIKVSTYNLYSAVSIAKKYARQSRMDVVGKSISRMLNEVLIKQERNAWAVLLKALAEATTNSLKHVVGSATAGVFQLDDLNTLMIRLNRINGSYANGTPDTAQSVGLTDLFLSPEMQGQVRGFAYQPMNTRTGSTGATTSNTAIALPDSIREQIFKASGTQEIYGVNIHRMNEFGTTQKYSVLFASFYGATSSPTYAAATQDILFGVDLSRDAAIRPIATNGDTGNTMDVQPDDSFDLRSDKLGFWLGLEEGRVVIDARAFSGLVT